MNDYQVIYNGTNLATLPDVDLYNHDFNKMPERKINIYKIARADMSIVTSSEYSSKDISVFMEVCGGGRSETEAALTNIRAVLQPQNGKLRVANGGVLMEYTATMNDFSIEWSGVTALVFIGFIASTPIGTAVDSQTLISLTAIGGSNSAFNLDVGGSFTARPYITIQYTAVTGGAGGSVTVQDNQTSQGITIHGDFAAGDIIEIDSTNFVVRHNGVSVDFEGLFPTFQPGTRQLLYIDDFTTRTGSIQGSYNPRYA